MAEFSSRFLRAHPEHEPFVDPAEGDEHAALLDVAGLSALNTRVLAATTPGSLVDAVAEHTVGAMLVRRGFTDLTYEPPSMGRRVDFVGRHGATQYAVEVKRLASSEHDALQSKVMRTLNEALKTDKHPVYVFIALAETFTKGHLNALERHIKATLRTGATDGTHCFPSAHEALAKYSLHPSPKRRHSAVGMTWDRGMLDVTGLDRNRVEHKIRNAYEKFAEDGAAVNVVVLQAGHEFHLSAVSEALYGSERFDMTSETLRRAPDGLLSRGKFSRLGAVLVARREAPRLFAPHELVLFTASAAPGPIADVFGAAQIL